MTGRPRTGSGDRMEQGLELHIHARHGRSRRLQTSGWTGALPVDRRQGPHRQGDDHRAQEAPDGELDGAAEKANRSISLNPPGRTRGTSPASSHGEYTRADEINFDLPPFRLN